MLPKQLIPPHNTCGTTHAPDGVTGTFWNLRLNIRIQGFAIENQKGEKGALFRGELGVGGTKWKS